MTLASRRNPSRPPGRRSRIAVIAALACVSIALPASGLARASRPPRPTVVVIVTDDQRWDSLWAMPVVQKELVDRGVSFSNAFVVNSLCCPSRASILTGDYSHTTGVYTNGGRYGGFGAFDDRSTIATWLHGAGYHTALIGKYLNGYEGRYIPPGWDRWFAMKMHGEGNYYYDYTVNDDGRLRSYGSRESDYSTDVLANESVQFIEHHRGPLFLYLATWGPHRPAIPAPRDDGFYSGVQFSRRPDFNEAKIGDKPRYIRKRQRLTQDQIDGLDREHRRELEALLSVDDAVGRVLDALRRTGRLHNSLIVFLSDNGIALGEHRWTNKQVPYEESIRVPLLIRYDRAVSSARTDRHLALNIDLASTIAQAAGVTPPRTDGRSLLPLITGSPVRWRHDFLVEHLNTEGPVSPPTYCAVRTTRYLYVLYGTGERELYDLRRDPYELRNRAPDPGLASVRRALTRRLHALCNPPPPGYRRP